MSFTGNNDRPKIRRRVRGFDLVKRLLAAAAGLVLLLIAAAYALVAASLPRRAGEARLPGLESPLTVALDARAIATVRGESFTDVLRGQGYLHAQERFFQMDLLRRSSAGELAELFGERALAADRGQRPFHYREHARRLRAALPAEQNAWLDAYSEGVNAGLADLGARPPEYWLAGGAPRPWQPEDSLLVVLTFYTMLSNNDSYERAQGVMHAVLPPPLYDFLTPSTSRFDRPVLGSSPGDPTGGYLPPSIPGPEVVDLRRQRAPERGGAPRVEPPLTGPASNNWAVDATRGNDGRAIVANDPHLELAATEHLLSHRARVAGPRSARREHSRLARSADRREQRRRVGRDRQQRRSERLGRRRGRSRRSHSLPHAGRLRGVRRALRGDRRRGRRERANRNARHALGPGHRGGLARPAARPARDVARAAGARPRHRGRLGRHRRRERERALGALGGAVVELGARRSRRRHRVGRQRPAAAPRRVRRLAARVAGRRQPLVARQAAAAGRARRPRRCAVHGQQPHAAARACRRRQPHVDAAAACEAHRRSASGAPDVRRARLPRDAARHARRRLRADPRHDSRNSRARTNPNRCWHERGSSRATGTGMPTSTSRRSVSCTRITARCSSARSSRC